MQTRNRQPAWKITALVALVALMLGIGLARPAAPAHAAPARANAICQWCYTGHPSYALWLPSWPYPTGQCTAYAYYRDHRDIGLGNARDWDEHARARGMWVHYAPRVGSTVVFEAYVQGAGYLGHVAYVEALYSGGWFLVSEMNFYFAGGGFGRVSFRFAHTGWGVSFIN